MEQLVKSVDISGELPDELYKELVGKFQESLKNKDWDSVEVLVIASRQVRYRTLLSHQEILGLFLDQYVWSVAEPVQARPVSLAVRLAANCSLGSEEVQDQLAQHIDHIQRLLATPGICEVTVGLLANMLFDDASTLEFSTILERGFHETITKQLAADNLDSSHPMFETAVEILDSLAEEDMEAKVPNVVVTTEAMVHVIDFLLKKPRAPFDHSNDHQLVEIILRWATSKEVRLEISKPIHQSSFYSLPQIYESTVDRNQEDLEDDAESQRQLSLFESILGEFASQAASSNSLGAGFDSLLSSAKKWIQPTAVSPTTNRLCATGYLILCNLCNDTFAVAAINEYGLHKIALEPLLREDSSSEINANAAAFLSNLCQPVPNKEPILNANIIPKIYNSSNPKIAVRLIRRFLSNASTELIQIVTEDFKKGLPHLKDIISLLPDQKAVQDGIRKTESNGTAPGYQAPNPELQLTKDVAHIYVAVRRHNSTANQHLTTSLVWALVNLVLIGLRTSNALDVSDGVFGLGLALQSKGGPNETLSLEAIEALRRGDGVLALKQVIEMGRGDQANLVAKKVAENATSVVHMLVQEAEKNNSLEEVVEDLQNMLKLGVDIKSEP